MIPDHNVNLLLQCYNVTKSYTVNGNTNVVLKGIHLSIDRGEIVVIRGKSGAGKSTLIEILGGLARQDSGVILFDNLYMENLSGEELARMRRDKIGIIFQSFNLIPSRTVYENIEAAFMFTPVSQFDRRQKITTLLEQVGLEEKMHHLPSELSVGQQQRVAIARAVANEPILLLADEPTGEVDAETAQEILHSLLTPIKEKGVAVIVTTHGNFPLDVADRVLHLEDGVIRDGH